MGCVCTITSSSLQQVAIIKKKKKKSLPRTGVTKGLFSGVRVRNFSDFLIHRHFPGANVDEAANSSTKGANVPIQKSGQREQKSRFKNRDEGSNSSRFKNSDEGCKLPDSKSGRREQKKKIFFFSQSVDRKCQSDHSAESLTGLSKRPS